MKKSFNENEFTHIVCFQHLKNNIKAKSSQSLHEEYINDKIFKKKKGYSLCQK